MGHPHPCGAHRELRIRPERRPELLVENLGDGRFRDVSEETGLTSTRWTLAAGAVDMDRDGFPELILANDYGVDEFFHNEEAGISGNSEATTPSASPESGS
ncbi:MAG: VCBS repeat-containing protein [Bacteroidales bacterium]